MKTILIFEPLSGGHRANFIGWLNDLINQNLPAGYRFVFVVSLEMEGISSPSVDFHRIPAETNRRMLWKLFCESCRRFQPDHVLILELTHLELPLALFGAPCPVSAILFVQYPELPHGLKFFSKHWKTALLLRRAPVKNLFLLNGEKSCDWLAGRFGSRARFIPVPDPAPAIESEPGFVLRDVYGISPDRKVFLFFGAISPRKGADVLIKALHLLPPATAAGSAFIFCGEPELHYRQAFEQSVKRLRTDRPDLVLNIETRFVSNQHMMALFEQSDVILMPYTRPEYSSGILALAAKARTPVIGPDSGLLGRLIRQYGLGTTCPVRLGALAKNIADVTQHLPAIDESLCSAFVQKSSPETFARTILNAVCNER